LAKIFLFGVLKPFLWLWFKVVQNVHFVKPKVSIPEGPILMVGNHNTNWDGFYSCVMFFSRFPHYIVHDELFSNQKRSRIIGNFLGQIRRATTENDPEPLKSMKVFVDNGQSVGVFPEGDIDMFGKGIPIGPTMGKMAKFLKVPVVIFKIKGAHLRAPRWSRLPHRSRIEVEVVDVISSEEVKTLTAPTIQKRVEAGIYSNEYDFQDSKKIKLLGPARAEWIELGLFLCPKCHRYETFHSKGNDFTCQSCGLKVTINQNLLLQFPEKVYFERPDKWDIWQQSSLGLDIDAMLPDALLFSAQDLKFETTPAEEYFKKNEYAGATIRLYRDRLEISTAYQEIKIPITEINKVRLQYKDTLEIFYGANKIRLQRSTPKWSAYLWVSVLLYLKKISV
jgi:1-acyl-sn-glycerol-3-phosphate acyltransferase